MGLDVYVMPIWKFKAGDFAAPVQSLGTVTIITPQGIMQRKADERPGFVTRWNARRATRRLRREIEAKIGHSVAWNEEGGVAYKQQARGFESLRAFATWLDYRDLFPTFEPPPDNNYYNHPVMSQSAERALTYPQLVDHSCHSGYFIPAELERVVYVEPSALGEISSSTTRSAQAIGCSRRWSDYLKLSTSMNITNGLKMIHWPR